VGFLFPPGMVPCDADNEDDEWTNDWTHRQPHYNKCKWISTFRVWWGSFPHKCWALTWECRGQALWPSLDCRL
jgi:hypothetical protein